MWGEMRSRPKLILFDFWQFTRSLQIKKKLDAQILSLFHHIFVKLEDKKRSQVCCSTKLGESFDFQSSLKECLNDLVPLDHWIPFSLRLISCQYIISTQTVVKTCCAPPDWRGQHNHMLNTVHKVICFHYKWARQLSCVSPFQLHL